MLGFFRIVAAGGQEAGVATVLFELLAVSVLVVGLALALRVLPEKVVLMLANDHVARPSTKKKDPAPVQKPKTAASVPPTTVKKDTVPATTTTAKVESTKPKVEAAPAPAATSALDDADAMLDAALQEEFDTDALLDDVLDEATGAKATDDDKAEKKTASDDAEGGLEALMRGKLLSKEKQAAKSTPAAAAAKPREAAPSKKKEVDIDDLDAALDELDAQDDLLDDCLDDALASVAAKSKDSSKPAPPAAAASAANDDADDCETVDPVPTVREATAALGTIVGGALGRAEAIKDAHQSSDAPLALPVPEEDAWRATLVSSALPRTCEALVAEMQEVSQLREKGNLQGAVKGCIRSWCRLQLVSARKDKLRVSDSDFAKMQRVASASQTLGELAHSFAHNEECDKAKFLAEQALQLNASCAAAHLALEAVADAEHVRELMQDD